MQADLVSAARPWPFDGHYLAEPRRDFFKIGAALLWAGYPEQALPYLEVVLDRSPKNVQTMVLVAQIHLEAKRTPLARTILEQALAADPTSAEAWNELGGVELAEGNPTRALDWYHKAVEIKPDLTYALMNAAQGYAQFLQAYDWPGNIRELQNVVERAVILCDGETFSIDETWLQPETRGTTKPPIALAVTLVNQERKMIEAALEESRGRISGPSGAAGKLGMPRTMLESKIKSLRINKHQFKCT